MRINVYSSIRIAWTAAEAVTTTTTAVNTQINKPTGQHPAKAHTHPVTDIHTHTRTYLCVQQNHQLVCNLAKRLQRIAKPANVAHKILTKICNGGGGRGIERGEREKNTHTHTLTRSKWRRRRQFTVRLTGRHKFEAAAEGGGRSRRCYFYCQAIHKQTHIHTRVKYVWACVGAARMQHAAAAAAAAFCLLNLQKRWTEVKKRPRCSMKAVNG